MPRVRDTSNQGSRGRPADLGTTRTAASPDRARARSPDSESREDGVEMDVLAQFPPRLLLAGAVLTAVTASAGTVLTFPDPVAAPAPYTPPPAPAAAPAPPAPAAGLTEADWARLPVSLRER